MHVGIEGLQETLAAMQARAERAADLEPVLRTFAEDLVTRIEDHYQASTNWDGEPFAALKPRTLEARIGKLPGANKRKGGKLTKAARKKREGFAREHKLLTAAGVGGLIKPLIDSADMKNSNHVQDYDSASFEWSSLGYLGFHMAGTTHMEARNPTPFEWKHGFWKLNDDVLEEFGDAVKAYILEGDL